MTTKAKAFVVGYVIEAAVLLYGIVIGSWQLVVIGGTFVFVCWRGLRNERRRIGRRTGR